MANYTGFAAWLAALGGTYSRASTAYYYNSSGVLTQAASGELRYDYDPVTHAAKGILLEGTRTNLLLQSQFASGWFTQVSAVLTPNQFTSPDGTTTGALVSFGANSISSIYQAISAGAGTYTLSVWAKGPSGGEKFRFASYNGTDGQVDSSNFTLTTSWQRYTATFTIAANSAWYIENASDAVARSIHVWGAQLEAGSFASSYIPTTSGSATRAADSLTFPTSPWFNQSAGTFFVELDTFDHNSNLGRIIADTGSVNTILHEIATTQVGTWNGSSELSKTSALNAAGISKAIMAYDATGRAITGAGLSPVTDANLLQTLSGYLKIGGDLSDAEAYYGHVRKIGYWPFRVTNSELQRLTT